MTTFVSTVDQTMGSYDSFSFNTSNEVLKDVIGRIEKISKEMHLQIPPKDTTLYNCSVLRSMMKNPVVINCGHTFDKSVIDSPHIHECPLCKKEIAFSAPNYFIKDLVEKYLQEDRIVTLYSCKRENKELAKKWIQMAKNWEDAKEYNEALTAYAQAFLYTEAAKDYETIPQLYIKLEDKRKATLAYLHLAIYQSKEGRMEKAIETLNSAKDISPIPLEIDVILTYLALAADPSEEQINKALFFASLEDPEEAIIICKYIISKNPEKLAACINICPSLKGQEERTFKTADLIDQQNKSPEILKLSLYPQAISKEDWINPMVFLEKLPEKPQELKDFLAAPCPIFGGVEGRTRAETHILCPRPCSITIDGQTLPFTLLTLDKLDKDTGGRGISIKVEISDFESRSPEIGFEWLVLTKDVLPGSKGKSYNFQEKLVQDSGYQMPGFRDAIACVLWEKRTSGTCFYSNDTYTCCKEIILGSSIKMGFGDEGLKVITFNKVKPNIGIAGLRKF